MKELLEKLSDPIFLVTVVIALIGIFLTILFGIKSLRKKEIAYAVESYELIKKFKLDDLKIQYRDKHIPDLTVTKIAFWNSGNITLNKDDIVDIHIEIGGKESDRAILSFESIYENDKTNKIVTRLVPDAAMPGIIFEYLGRKDGAVLQILTSGKVDGINMIGKIKDGKIKRKRSTKRIQIITGVCYGIAFTSMLILFYTNMEYLKSNIAITFVAVFSLLTNFISNFSSIPIALRGRLKVNF